MKNFVEKILLLDIIVVYNVVNLNDFVYINVLLKDVFYMNVNFLF